MAAYDESIDASAMRCPRCLVPWDPSWVDLVAESATCRGCSLTVGLLGDVVPRWERSEVAGQLDVVERRAPWAEGISVSERAGGRHLELRGKTRFLRARPTLALDDEGVASKAGDARLPLRDIARIIPVAIFDWERSGSGKTLVVRSVVRAVPAIADAAPLDFTVPTWAAARHFAARMERVRRALLDRGGYR